MPTQKPNFNHFNYVVIKEKPNPICFLSKQERHTSPIGKYLAPLQKRYAPEIFPNVGPQNYELPTFIHKLDSKPRSRKGIGFLASDSQRIPKEKIADVPSPAKYNLRAGKKPAKQKKAPFGVSVTRKYVTKSKTPGPSAVESRQCRRTNVAYNFGKPRIIDAVPVYCLADGPQDICNKCSTVCDGDYWKSDEDVLCHCCWVESRVFTDEYTNKLKNFTKVRTCSFMHSHEGTTAAVRTIARNKLKKKIRLENYLYLYSSCRNEKIAR